MDTRWSAFHMLLLTLGALCNSQQVPNSQSFVPNVGFNRSPQQTQTSRQQNNPFNGGGFSRAQTPLRTPVEQPRRPTIRKPASRLPTETSQSPTTNDQQHVLFAFKRPEQPRNQNEQSFGRESPIPQAEVRFAPQRTQNPQRENLHRQNPTTPSTIQVLPKQTFQRIQIPSTLKSQSPTQAQLRLQSHQSRFQIPQQSQGFSQQSQPQFTGQQRDQDFKPSQEDNVFPNLPQSQHSQRGFQGVFPTSQQLPHPSQIQQPQQPQQAIPSLAPLPQLPQTAQPQRGFQGVFHNSHQLPQTSQVQQQPQRIIEDTRQLQQTFPTLPPPSQPPQTLQQQQRGFQAVFPDSQELPQPSPVQQPQRLIQEARQTQQTFPTLAPLPQPPPLPQPAQRQRISKQPAQKPQQEFEAPQQVFQAPQQQEELKTRPKINKRLKSRKQLSFEASQQEQTQRFRAPQQQTFQQPSQDFSTTEQPKQIFQVITNPPQQQNIDQQRFTQPQSSFVSRNNDLKQQQIEERSRVNQQLTQPRTQQVQTIPEFNKPNEGAEIKHRFQLAQRQQQELETSSKQSNVRTKERNQSSLKNPSKDFEDERIAQEKDDEFNQQAENARYSFSSSVKDSINDNQFSREETRDGKKVSGSYSYSDGFVMRTVQYEADENGFRVVKENSEPIGEGPLEDLDGRADVTSSISGNDVAYSITADDVPHLAKLRDEPEV